MKGICQKLPRPARGATQTGRGGPGGRGDEGGSWALQTPTSQGLRSLRGQAGLWLVESRAWCGLAQREQAAGCLARLGAGGRGGGVAGERPAVGPAWGALRPWSSRPSLRRGGSAGTLRGSDCPPGAPPHPACLRGAAPALRFLWGRQVWRAVQPPLPPRPLQLRTAAVRPGLRRGWTGPWQAEAPAQPAEARRGATSLWAGRTSLRLVGWQRARGPRRGQPDGTLRGPVSKPPGLCPAPADPMHADVQALV